MASAKMQKWTGFLTCRQILNIMVILGFMFNYMLRVNLTIAIVAMIHNNNNNNENSTDLSSNLTFLQPTTPSTIVETTTIGTTDINYMKFDWTESQKNDILGSFFWGYILTELPGGRMSEIIGARRVFGGGMLLASLLTLLSPAACYLNYYVILVLRALLGFCLGATWPAIVPMATKWIPPLERSKFIANMMASSLGAALTMPLCGYLISIHGWASVFYVTGGIALIWSIAWFLLVFDSPAQHPRISLEEKLEIEGKIAEHTNKKMMKPKNVPWFKILTSGPVWAIILTHGCSVFCYFTVVNQLPSYMDHVLHFNIKKNGLLSSLPYLGKYIMAIIASYLADRLRQTGKLSTTITRKLFTTFAVLTPGFLMIIQAFLGQDPIVSVIVFTISLFFNGAVTAGYLSNGLDIAPNFSGTIFGLANTLSSFGGWLSTKIVAILTEHDNTFEQWRYVFWILVATYFLGSFIYLLLGSGELQSWNSVSRNSFDDGFNTSMKEMQPLNNGNKYEQQNGKEIVA